MIVSLLLLCFQLVWSLKEPPRTPTESDIRLAKLEKSFDNIEVALTKLRTDLHHFAAIGIELSLLKYQFDSLNASTTAKIKEAEERMSLKQHHLIVDIRSGLASHNVTLASLNASLANHADILSNSSESSRLFSDAIESLKEESQKQSALNSEFVRNLTDQVNKLNRHGDAVFDLNGKILRQESMLTSLRDTVMNQTVDLERMPRTLGELHTLIPTHKYYYLYYLFLSFK